MIWGSSCSFLLLLFYFFTTSPCDISCLWSTLGFKSTGELLKHMYYHIHLIVFLVDHAMWRFNFSMIRPWPQTSTFNWHLIRSNLINAQRHTSSFLLGNPDTRYRYGSPNEFIELMSSSRHLHLSHQHYTTRCLPQHLMHHALQIQS